MTGRKEMTIGWRRWSVAMSAVCGLLIMGVLCLWRGHTEPVFDIVVGIVGTVAGYCGFDMGAKVAQYKHGAPETGEKP